MIQMIKNMMGQQDNTELISAIEGGAYLVDVRSPEEFNGGSVKGAVNIPLDTVPNQLSKFKGKKGVVVFCQSGGRSGAAKGILEKNGIPNVINGGGHANVRKCVK
ncbi:MAG: rhodanese-like domain-containing protein [Candidatus Kapaibacterium sp.]